MKIGLGTVQFGLDYGIANREGKIPLEQATRIINLADMEGIDVLDTASMYGTSEDVLGKCLKPGHKFKIVTKTPIFDSGVITIEDARLLENTLLRSLAKLGQSSLYGLLVHHSDNLLAPNGQLLMDSLLELKHRGLVKKVGVSVYTARQIDALMERYDTIDIIQLPVSIFDQRLLQSGHLTSLKKAGIEIHARSVFLQGLTLMSPDELPGFFEPIKAHIEFYRDTLKSCGLSPLQGSLGFVLNLEQIDVALCGVDNYRHLQEIVSAAHDSFLINNFEQFALHDDRMLNPSLWEIS